MGYPSELLTDDETVLREFHPHWRTLLTALMWSVVAVAGIVLAWVFVDDPSWAPWALTGLALLFGLATAGRDLIAWRFTQYVLTTERIVVRRGVISRSGTEIPLDTIDNVVFNQSVTERMLGYGDVIIESAQGANVFDDIPHPETFQSQVYRAREDRTMHLSSGRSPRSSDPVDQLERLAALHQQGHLTDEEFVEQKRRLLDD